LATGQVAKQLQFEKAPCLSVVLALARKKKIKKSCKPQAPSYKQLDT
jgi:hypothetical protein